MADKSLSLWAAALVAPKAVHLIVNAVKIVGVLAGMSIAGGPFARCRIRYIHVVSRPEMGTLLARHHFKKVKRESLSHFQPGVVDQQRVGAMVFVRVERPMRENNIGVLCRQDPAIFVIAYLVYLDLSIHLPGKNRSPFQDFARFRSL